MRQTNVACIGSGAMGQALTEGMARGAGRKCAGRKIAPCKDEALREADEGLEFIFTDHTLAKAESAAAVCRNLGADAKVAKNAASAIESADYVFLAVKPAVYAKTLDEIMPSLASCSEKPVLVSMTTGAANSLFAEKCPGLPVIQIMPNTPCRVGAGVTGFCNISASPEQADRLEHLLSYAGLVVRIEEGKMQALSAISGCGPAYVYVFLEALADGGVRCGLSRKTSLDLAAKTLAGGAAMYAETGLHPGALKDQVCSPAGSTIEGITVLEERGFRGTVIDAVSAAYRR